MGEINGKTETNMKLNLKTLGAILIALQITSWYTNGFSVPEGDLTGIIFYEIGRNIPLILGVILLVISIKKSK